MELFFSRWRTTWIYFAWKTTKKGAWLLRPMGILKLLPESLQWLLLNGVLPMHCCSSKRWRQRIRHSSAELPCFQQRKIKLQLHSSWTSESRVASLHFRDHVSVWGWPWQLLLVAGANAVEISLATTTGCSAGPEWWSSGSHVALSEMLLQEALQEKKSRKFWTKRWEVRRIVFLRTQLPHATLPKFLQIFWVVKSPGDLWK